MRKEPDSDRMFSGYGRLTFLLRLAGLILFLGIFHVNLLALPSGQSQQKITINGTVKDASNDEFLPGASIIVKGTAIVTVTDNLGNFRLNVPGNDAVLIISFIGYDTQEVPLNGKSVINVKLSPEVKEIQDVVVVGYGAQKKQSVVGAISRTSGEQIKKMNVPEVANSLTGLIPGMITIKTTALPGGYNTAGIGNSEGSNYDQKTKIYLRGQSTWNGGEPLVLVDGVERSIDNIDAAEVENISVLKDASATSVFGVRGANGVILVTTRRGQESKPQLTFDGQVSLSFVSKIASVLRSYDAVEFKNRAIVNELAVNPASWGYYTPKTLLDYYKTQQYPELYPDVNWRQYIMKDFATAYKFGANLSGGTKFVNYFGSLNYTHEGGIIKGTDLGTGYKPEINFDRLNVRSNLDFNFTPTTKVVLNIFGSYNRQTDVASAANNWRIWSGIYQRPPDLIPLKYSDGTYAQTGADYPNPYALLNYGGLDYANRVEFTSDIKVIQKLDMITKGLSAGATVSYDNSFSHVGPRIAAQSYITKYVNPKILDAKTKADSASFITWVIPSTNSGYNWVYSPTSYSGDAISVGDTYRQINYEFRLDYARKFEAHSVSALALMTRQEGAAGGSFKSRRESWVGRVTYDYDTRYFLEVNAGYNGSEKFDSKYRFGLFPSAAVGWMISNEKFFKSALPWWSTLKARYSYGLVGSDAGISRWLYVSSWTVGSAAQQRIFGIPSGQSSGYYLSEEGAIANPDIHWETAIKQNLGFDMGFFKDMLKANVELFYDYRYDMLIPSANRANNVIFGASLPPANLGEAKTKGYETELSYNKMFKRGLGIMLSISHSFAKDKILFKDDPELRPDYQKMAGYQIDQTRTYVSAGITQSWDDLYTTVLDASNANRLPGDYKNIDFNADGVIDSKDVIPYAYPSRPQHTYSFSLGASYKGLSLTAMFYGQYNVTIDESYFTMFNTSYSVAYPWQRDESWMPEYGQTTSAIMKAPRFLSTNQTSYYSQYNLVDGSYLKLKNLEIAYQLNEKQLKRIGIGNLRFYLTGYDLLFFSKLREDREGASRTEGGSYASYPLMKRFTFGLSLGL